MHLINIDSYLVSAILQVPIIKTSKNKNLQSEMELTFLWLQMIASLKQHKGNTSLAILLIAIQNHRYFNTAFHF